ncbi:MAG: site-specific integrase [Cellulomonas sp.]|uniref:tyrosine-type recombinase/integrase n=1 Tax=Cellulomonas sp. TaxID=40001 RepID=UPI002585A8CB|nr:site-specific integrase [Cellulomonas sp.]MCR6706529.1 site-specific integrase [Cellulomonas sp.]
MAWTRRRANGMHQGLYRDASGRVRTADGGPWSRKAEALRRAAEAEAAARALGWRDPAAAGELWGTWRIEWESSRTVEPSTKRSDEGRLTKHLEPRWGKVPLVEITRHDVKAWYAELQRDGLAPATAQRCIHLLSASLNAAVDAGVLGANPAARLRLSVPAPATERYLTHAEFDAIVSQLAEPWARMARLLAGTGLRWGEAAGLHANRVTPAWVQVVEVWDQADRRMKAYPKGKKRRQVPLPEWVQLDAASGTCGMRHVRGACRGGLVVTSVEGSVMDSGRFRTQWDAACRAAGVGHVRIHDLRHTYASWLLQAGVSLAEVGRLLGHESPLTTQRYAHLAETPSAQVLAALGQHEAPGADVAGRGHLRVV